MAEQPQLSLPSLYIPQSGMKSSLTCLPKGDTELTTYYFYLLLATFYFLLSTHCSPYYQSHATKSKPHTAAQVLITTNLPL